LSASPRVLLVFVSLFFGGTWVAAPWATEEIHPLAGPLTHRRDDR